MKLPIATSQNPTISIRTQIEEFKKLGQGRYALLKNQQFNTFLEIDYNTSSDYIKKLYKDFRENYIAEATKNESQSKSLFK